MDGIIIVYILLIIIAISSINMVLYLTGNDILGMGDVSIFIPIIAAGLLFFGGSLIGANKLASAY